MGRVRNSSAPVHRLGAYELVQRIATGGMAEVYVAQRTGAYGFTKNVALKRILPQLAKDPEFVAMFIDEARVCSRLTHPNLVEVLDFGEENGELFMAMELVVGTTCAKLVRTAAARGEVIPLENSVHIALSILRGLEYAHMAVDENGVPLHLVHRDVSPGNVLISQTGVVKLGDFGIVRSAELERRTNQGQLKGKLGYMSPEQVLGKELDARSDLFTLGIVLAELLTGHPLFSQGTEMDILLRIRDADTANFTKNAGSLPEELRAVMYRVLSKEKQERFASAAEFAEALEDIVRRRRMALSASRLATYLDYLGLVKTTRSGHFRLSTPSTDPSGGSVPSMRPATRVGLAMPSDPALTGDGETPVETTLYRVILADGATSDALPLPRVLELIVSGKAAPNPLISCNQGQFLPADQYVEFKRVTASAALRWEMDVGQSERGVIDFATLPLHLFDLATRRETGALHAIAGDRRKKVYFVDGMAEYTVSTDRGEMLGEYFLREGLILPMELDMALALAPRYGGRIGDALVGLGILRPMDIFRGLIEQVKGRFVDLLHWRTGELIFVRGTRSHEEALPHTWPPFDLITRGVLLAYTEEELWQILSPMLGEPLRFGQRLAPSVGGLRLPHPETQTLLAVEDGITGAELLKELSHAKGFERTAILRGIFLGLSARTIEIDGWPERYRLRDLSSIPTKPSNPLAPRTVAFEGLCGTQKCAATQAAIRSCAVSPCARFHKRNPPRKLRELRALLQPCTTCKARSRPAHNEAPPS